MLEFPNNHDEILQKKLTVIQCYQIEQLEKHKKNCFNKFKNSIQNLLNNIFNIKNYNTIITEIVDLNYNDVQLCYENPLFKTLLDELFDKSFEIKKSLSNTNSESLLLKYDYLENETNIMEKKQITRLIIIEHCNLIDDEEEDIVTF